MMKINLMNKRFQPKSNTGFTLVEALVSTAIFTLLFGACVITLLTGQNSWEINTKKTELQDEVRKAESWIENELIQGGQSTITDVPSDSTWYNTITFKTVTGVSSGSVTWSANTINYALSSNRFIRTSGGTTKTVAQNIQTMQFRRLSTAPSLVEVSITGQKTTPRGTVVTAADTLKIYLRV